MRGSPDLSTQIVAALDREPGDLLRCTRVGGDYYRCNWWGPENAIGSDDREPRARVFTTHRVRKSQFLEVTATSKGLEIRIHSDAGVGVRAASATVRPHARSITSSM